MYDVVFWCKRCPDANWTLWDKQLFHLHSYEKAKKPIQKIGLSDFDHKISVGTLRLLRTSDDTVSRISFAQKMRIDVTITMVHSEHHKMHSSLFKPRYRNTQVYPTFAPNAHQKRFVCEVKWTCLTLIFGAKVAHVQTEHFGTQSCAIYNRMQRQKTIWENRTFGLCFKISVGTLRLLGTSNDNIYNIFSRKSCAYSLQSLWYTQITIWSIPRDSAPVPRKVKYARTLTLVYLTRAPV